MGVPPTQPSVPKIAAGGNLTSGRRRQSNGETDSSEFKPKRGRPRKKKEDKYVVLLQ